jgi:dTDP-4-dehydrorhamnose 3,5-epimerase
MIKLDSSGFNKFGEVYFSEVLPNSIKAWKKHSLHTQNFSVPVGMIKLVIFDDREFSPTKGNIQTIYLGRPDNYIRVTIPPNLWYGFKSIENEKSLVVNCSDYPHDPTESLVLSFDSHLIPYDWKN